jgi:hemoglobin
MDARSSLPRAVIIMVATILGGSLSLAAVGGKPTKTPPLFERLGKRPGIEALVTEGMTRLSSDTRLMGNARVAKFAKEVNRKALKQELVEHVCQATGGPCRPNRAVLRKIAGEPIPLGTAEWLYVMQDVGQALRARKVSTREQSELFMLIFKLRQSAAAQSATGASR